MIVINDLYDYGLKIYQNTDYFKFSLDSILLGEFVKLKNNYTILDMCTGNAPIPLILSTKNSTINIDCVEVQAEVFELATKSIKLNFLEDKIKIHNIDIKEYYPNKKYDIVTCNPPYFKSLKTTEKNNNPVKCLARHEILITLEEIIPLAKKFLKENGTFYLVQRVERFLETIDLLQKNSFGIRNVVFINTKKCQNAEIFLIEASLSKKSDLKVKTLDIYNLKTYKNIF